MLGKWLKTIIIEAINESNIKSSYDDGDSYSGAKDLHIPKKAKSEGSGTKQPKPKR
jgi:hypothetical protein